MTWPPWYWHPLQTHCCYFYICLHFTWHLDAHIPTLFPRESALYFKGLLSSLALPTFQALPHTLLGVHRDSAYQSPLPKHGKAPCQELHTCVNQAWEGATITPLSHNTGWGWWYPSVAKSLQRASATAHQIAPDWVDGEQEEVFCCLHSHMTAWWTSLPLQYLNETSACLTSSKPEIFVKQWVKFSLVSAAVALLTFWAVL